MTVVTTASGLRWQLPPVDFFGQGRATKRCTPVKARQFRTAVFGRMFFVAINEESEPTERLLRFPLMVVFLNYKGLNPPKTSSVLNFMFENYEAELGS